MYVVLFQNNYIILPGFNLEAAQSKDQYSKYMKLCPGLSFLSTDNEDGHNKDESLKPEH